MEHKIVVRQATSGEFPELLPLFTQFFRDEGLDIERLPITLHAMLAHPESAIFVAWLGIDILGVATVTTTSPGLEFERYGELEDLYVVPQARNQGVGRLLMHQVKVWCTGKACGMLGVVVLPEDQAERDVLHYYQKNNFIETGRSILFQELTKLDSKSNYAERARPIRGDDQ